ncbi:ParB N-terminal domain-containing protein [Synechococcus sp. WH 8101]|uniref:DNA methyltransferase n=1 Tax=Synechococcus sp. WH 8101 TaxID=59932 RepID=UPI00164B2453|nr:ParB N-terminal domain-containing protein [Synechococcus sp. WH 8101]
MHDYENAEPKDTIEIPIDEIKVNRRMRRTDEERIKDLAESIKNIGLLHNISVALKDGSYVLLSGLHRLEAFKILGRTSITATVRQSNDRIDQLIEVEENLVRSELNAIQTAEHIIKREELLIALGKKAVVGNNQYTEDKITNEDLARQMGYTKRTYQYKRSVANLNPEVKDLLSETKFAENLMDMVKLQKEPDHIQLEVANLLLCGKARTFRRAFVMAQMKFKQDRWTDEIKEVKDKIGIPKSIMKWERKDTELTKICSLVSDSEDTIVNKRTAYFGTNPVRNYQTNPEMSRWFINFFSKEGDLVMDNFAGRGSNLIAAAYEGRRVVGYDLSSTNLDLIRGTCLEHTRIKPEDLTLHHSCGIELAEYESCSDHFDMIINDVPYIFGAEDYKSGDDRDLCKVKNLDEYHKRMEVCLKNMKRLIKPSSWKDRIFNPIVMKVGSGRRNSIGTGLVSMDVELEIIARKVGLTIHDKIFNELRSSFQSFNVGRCIENKYTIKSHECSVVMVKYVKSQDAK